MARPLLSTPLPPAWLPSLVQGGLQPDAYTFAAVLHACLQADECELAVDVYK